MIVAIIIAIVGYSTVQNILKSNDQGLLLVFIVLELIFLVPSIWGFIVRISDYDTQEKI